VNLTNLKTECIKTKSKQLKKKKNKGNEGDDFRGKESHCIFISTIMIKKIPEIQN
jgi:hypothetical protein